jgi:8-oxo-dGTP diphosphatase
MRETARRELLEETGMTAESFTWVNCDNDTRSDGAHYVQFGFLAEDATGEPKLCEPDRCYEWGWFALDALPEPLFVGHYKQIEAFIGGQKFVE